MKVKVWHVATDTDNGTETAAFATKREAEDFVLEQVGSDRAELDSWIEEREGGDDESWHFWEFIDERKDRMDTYTLDSTEFDVATLERIA